MVRLLTKPSLQTITIYLNATVQHELQNVSMCIKLCVSNGADVAMCGVVCVCVCVCVCVWITVRFSSKSTATSS